MAKTSEESGGAFAEPRLAINRVYTRLGDGGQTSLVGGQRVRKDDARIECYGTVDELNAFTGLARQSSEEASLHVLAATLKKVQHELFNLGSILATRAEDVHPRQPRVTNTEIEWLESEMDTALKELPPLRSFVLPGGSRLNAELHLCRTVCRRAERLCVSLSQQEPVDGDTLKYLNRLSDAFFVWSRWASREMNCRETLWQPNEAPSGHAESGPQEEMEHD